MYTPDNRNTLWNRLKHMRWFSKHKVEPSMKKKLLIVVGAGASLDFGMPSVTKIDNLFDGWAAGIAPLVSDPSSNLYRFCRDTINQYYSKNPKPLLRKWTNFEEVLYQLDLLSPYFSDPSYLHSSNAILTPHSLPDVYLFGGTPQKPAGDALTALTNKLRDDLVDHFIDACSLATKSKASEISELRSFLTDLRNEFDIGILSLNYDDIFMQACPDLYTGFGETGCFSPLSVMARSEWNFLYNIHGSIHFEMVGSPTELHKIRWTDSPHKGNSVHSLGRNSQFSTEGTSYPTSPIVAGYGKTQQILRQPFRTYFAQINRLVEEADSFLFIGYGFGDIHLNAAFSDVRHRACPTLVIDWAPDNQDPLPFRRDTWSTNLFRTLPVNAHSMSAPGRSAPADIADLKAGHDVECSNDSNYPLAVWYNGLLDACRNAHKLTPYLH